MGALIRGAICGAIGVLYFVGMSACAPKPNYDPTYLGVKKIMEMRQ